MKILPCRGGCGGRPAQMTRDGLVHCVGRLSSSVYRYRCLACRQFSRITSIEFNRLPRMTADQIARLTDLPVPQVDPDVLQS